MSILVRRMSHWVVLEPDPARSASQLIYRGTRWHIWLHLVLLLVLLPPAGVDLMVGVVFLELKIDRKNCAQFCAYHQTLAIAMECGVSSGKPCWTRRL